MHWLLCCDIHVELYLGGQTYSSNMLEENVGSDDGFKKSVRYYVHAMWHVDSILHVHNIATKLGLQH